ncbi:MAG: M56 family metallopeptidase, partial [Candidatus Acidiferrales bacterium]
REVMTPASLARALAEQSPAFLAHVAGPAVRSLLVAGIAASALVALRVKDPSARLAVWKMVLCAALAMPALVWALPALPVPIFFAVPAEANVPSARAASMITNATGPESASAERVSSPVPARFSRSVAAPGDSSRDHRETFETIASAHSQQAATPRRSFNWPAAAVAIYLVVAVLLLARLMFGFFLSRRLLRASRTLHDSSIVRKLAEIANSSAGFRDIPRPRALPRLAESDFVFVPVTLGVLRPAIILPAGWRDWDDAKLSAVLAHELSHVRRRDALAQHLSLIHRAIFWFSPLAWWLDRALATLAEIASDHAALAGGLDRIRYAETLLGFFESLQQSRRRVWWQGVSMAAAGNAERRIAEILSGRNSMSTRIQKLVLLALFVLAGPVLLAAAAVHPFFVGVQAQATPRPAAPAAPTSTSPPSASMPQAPTQSTAPLPDAAPPVPQAPESANAALPAPTVPAIHVVIPETRIASIHIAPIYVAPIHIAPIDIASVRLAVPVPVIPPVHVVIPSFVIAPSPLSFPALAQAPNAPGSSVSSPAGVITFSFDSDDLHYVIVSGDSTTISGDSGDAEHVQALRKENSGDFIWFERDGKSYIIRDPAIVKRARELFAPMDRLSKQQDELGARQEALGKQQDALGQQQEEVRVNIPDMSAQLRELEAKMHALSNGGTPEQLGELQSELGELQGRLGELQAQAAVGQSSFGEKQGELGRQQGELGRQQGELGRRQGELAKEANRQLKKMFDDSLANGTAKPE